MVGVRPRGRGLRARGGEGMWIYSDECAVFFSLLACLAQHSFEQGRGPIPFIMNPFLIVFFLFSASLITAFPLTATSTLAKRSPPTCNVTTSTPTSTRAINTGLLSLSGDPKDTITAKAGYCTPIWCGLETSFSLCVDPLSSTKLGSSNRDPQHKFLATDLRAQISEAYQTCYGGQSKGKDREIQAFQVWADSYSITVAGGADCFKVSS